MWLKLLWATFRCDLVPALSLTAPARSQTLLPFHGCALSLADVRFYALVTVRALAAKYGSGAAVQQDANEEDDEAAGEAHVSPVYAIAVWPTHGHNIIAHYTCRDARLRWLPGLMPPLALRVADTWR